MGHCLGLDHLDSCMCRSHIVGAPRFDFAGDNFLIFTPLAINDFRKCMCLHHVLLKLNGCNHVFTETEVVPYTWRTE